MSKRLLLADLSAYMVTLSTALDSLGRGDAAAKVQHLASFASGSTSEFYGEARLLLPRVLEEQGERLPPGERTRLRETIRAIEHEFDLIGGA